MNFIHSDELVTAIALNLHPVRILDKALEHPITITRNDQSFALTKARRRSFICEDCPT